MLPPHYGRNVNIQRHTYNQYQQPYSECSVLEDNTLVTPLDDRTVFDLVVSTGYAYTRKTCFMVCRQFLITRTCGCNSYAIDYRVPNFGTCEQEENTLNAGKCMTRMKAKSTFIAEYSFQRCPLECRISFFNTAISEYTYDKNYFNSFLDTFRYRDDVPNGTDLIDYINGNMVELRLNYDTRTWKSARSPV